MRVTCLIVMIFALTAVRCTEDPFEELKKDDFGLTLSKTIELQLSTADNVDDVVGMVREVRSDLRDQLALKSEKHEEYADQCRATVNELQAKMDAAEMDHSKNDRLLMIDGPVLDSRVEEKANKEAELAERHETAAYLDEANDQMVANFNAVVEEHRAVQTMMHTARAIIVEGFKGGEEFLQVKTSVYSKFASHIRAFQPKEQGLSHGYHQVFQVLANIAERAQEGPGVQADQGIVDSILRIFDDIEENLANSLAIERNAEDQRLAAYDELVARIDGEIASLNTKLADLGRVILNLQFACSSYESAMELAQDTWESNDDIMGKERERCEQEDWNWSNTNAILSGEITIAGNAIYLLENKRELLERYRA